MTAFEALRYQWNEFNGIAENGNIFLSWIWLCNWWKIYSTQNDTLNIMMLYQDNRLISICPFYIQYTNSESILRFIGTGEAEIAEVASEYMDILCLQEYKKEVISKLYQYFTNVNNPFQRIEFNRVLENSLAGELVALLTKQYYIRKLNIGLRYYIDLYNTSWSQYLSRVASKSFKKKIHQCHHRFLALPSSRYYVLTDLPSIEKLYPQLIELHQRMWQSKGKAGAFYSEQFKQFHLNLIRTIVDKGEIRLLIIEANTKLIAVFYYLISHDCCHYYQSGIDRDYRPNISPGFLGHSLMIQYCIEHHIKGYDFMMGNIDGSYKSKFMPDTGAMFDYYLVQKNLSGFFVYLKWKIQKIRYYLSE